MEEVYAFADKLSEVIENMQRCLQCTICLHTISDPVKTLCGHGFCRACIQTVLQNKNALCPLCNTALHRRSITRDEHMKQYIDLSEKLIHSIREDSGIDLLSHLPRPRDALKNRSDKTECSRPDDLEEIKPGCSHDLPSLSKKFSSQRSKRSTQRQRKSTKGQKTKNGSEQKEGSGIMKYLSKFSVSGVEPMLPDESRDYQEKSMEEKVHSWLENLPETNAYEDTNTAVPLEQQEHNLDDTLITSVSQCASANKPETSDKKGVDAVEPATGNSTRRSMARQFSRRSLRNEKEETRRDDKRGPRGNSVTRAVDRNEAGMDWEMDNPKPGTSGTTKGYEERRKKSQERSNDVPKSSPSELLPGMKKNWSSVKEFGKEMRTRRKKLKSLNISIENTGKPRSLDEHAASINRKDLVKEKETNGEENERSTGTMSKDVARTSSDERLVDGKKKSSVENKDAPGKGGSPRSGNSRSISEELQAPGESSFIMLGLGEQVHIRNLNSSQMNDIIGVSGVRQLEELEKAVDDNPEVKRDHLSSTPLKSVEMEGNSSGALLKEFADMNESRSAVKSPVSTPNRRRFSLKKRSIDGKPTDAISSSSNSRVQAVKRDLKLAIDQSEKNNQQRGSNVEESGETIDRRHSQADKQTDRKENVNRVKGAKNWSDLVGEKEERSVSKRPLVVFRKMGRIYNHRKKGVKFLYMGSTCRKSLSHSFPSSSVQKPCNPVDILDAQDNGFGNRVTITVNDTPAVEELDDRNASNTKESPSRSKISTFNQPSTSKEPVQVNRDDKVSRESQDSDVLLVTVDEKEQIFQHPVAPSAGLSKKTSSSNVVRMLSPTKDSQLQFLSLGSPAIEHLEAPRLIEKSVAAEDNSFPGIKGAHSRALVRMSQKASSSSDSLSTPRRKRKRSRSRECFSRRIRKVIDEGNDGCSSSSSLPSQDTYVKKPDKEVVPADGKNYTVDEYPSTSTKDIDNVSLSSDADILESSNRAEGKVYRRIVQLGSSGTSSTDLVCLKKPANDQFAASPTSKRKRDVSPDSDVEADLNELVGSWHEDARHGQWLKKKSKLEEIRNSANSLNASREARNNSTAKFCSNVRGEETVKLPEWRSRRPAGFAGSSASEKSNLVGTKLRQELRDRAALVVDDDSPDFAATIDKVKDLRAEGFFDGKRTDCRAESLMQDNFDEVMANVVTDSLMDNYFEQKEFRADRSQDKGRSARNTSEVNQDAAPAESCNNSDKENAYKSPSPLYDDDIDKTLTPEHASVGNRSSGKDKLERRIKAMPSTSKMENMRSQSNKSAIYNFAASVDHDKHASDENAVNDSTGKDTLEQDSLMNITQHYLMIKQFEEDLFGKSKSSAAESEQARQSLPSLREKESEGEKTNAKDVEHSGEEDDIVENTPDTKTKTSSRCIHEVSHVSPLARLLEDKLPNKSPASTSGRSSSGISTPLTIRRTHPLYQSTPKTEKPISNNNCSAAKTISSMTSNAMRNSTQKVEMAESIQSPVSRGLCFVCSGLLPSQIANVKRLSAIAGARYVAQFDHEVSHVIVKVDTKNNGASKTLKYLQGIAHRKWIVNYQWVLDSLKEGSLINEEPYEAVDSRTLEAGPRKSRLREKNLFEGFVFLCIGPYDDVSVEQYRDLLRATGATVVDSLDALAVEKKRLKIIVIQADVYNYEIIQWYRKARAIPIVHDWVIECISQYKLISFYPYLQELSRQDVLVLGFPEFLVEEEHDDDSDITGDEST